MDDDRPWLGEEPSARPDLTFKPLPAALGVFTAVAGPVVFVAVSRPAGVSILLVGIGVLAGLLAAVAAGLWVAARRGRVSSRRQL